METPNDFNTTVETIAYRMTEDYDNFILERISDYSENVLQTKINKEELKRIIRRGSKIDDVIDKLKTISKNARKNRYYKYSDGVDAAIKLLEDI